MGELEKMAINNVFSQLPSEIRYSNLSDFAKLLWAELYAYNFQKQYFISNNQLSKDFNKSIVTISRTITELSQGGFITVKYINGKRHITIKNLKVIEEQNYQFNEANILAIKNLIDNWRN